MNHAIVPLAEALRETAKTFLAAKLADDPNNFEGWMRIIRSYVVLDQRPKAEAALQTALKTFPADSENGRQLVALARDLSISTGGGGQ